MCDVCMYDVWSKKTTIMIHCYFVVVEIISGLVGICIAITTTTTTTINHYFFFIFIYII